MKPSKPVTIEEAEQLLPDGDRIHVFLDEGDGNPLSQTWSRASILSRIQAHGVELSGDEARSASHGLVSIGVSDTLFVETRKEPKA